MDKKQQQQPTGQVRKGNDDIITQPGGAAPPPKNGAVASTPKQHRHKTSLSRGDSSPAPSLINKDSLETTLQSQSNSNTPPLVHHSSWGSTLSGSRDEVETALNSGEVEVADPKRYKCLVRVVGGEGLRKPNGKLFSCYVNMRIPGGAMATSTIKKEENPFWDQSALMEMGKKPSNLYVEVMCHEPKVFGASKEVLLSKTRIPLRKFIRGKETDLKLTFPEIQGFLMIQIAVRGFGRSWREGSRMEDYVANEMEDKDRYVTHIRIIKTATPMSQAKTEYSTTHWEIP